METANRFVMVLNRRKLLIQILVLVVGLTLLGALFYSGYERAGWDFSGRLWKKLLERLAKPAQVGLFGLVALYFARVSLRHMTDLKAIGRLLLRGLQVIHVPLATVVLAAAGVHGLLYILYWWKPEFEYWSGLAALGAMAAVSGVGLLTAVSRRRFGRMHLVLGMAAFLLAWVHMALD